MKLRKTIGLVLILVLALTLSPASAGALPHTAFFDAAEWVTSPEDLTPNGPYGWAMKDDEIADATAWEIINGYPGIDYTFCLRRSSQNCDLLITWKGSPSFKPGNAVTHSEFAAILARGIGATGETSITLPFADVGKDAWYVDSLKGLYAKGIVKRTDHGDDAFRPEQPISRALMAAWVARAVDAYRGAKPADLSRFVDAAEIPAHLRTDVAKAVELGIIKGVGGNQLDPNGTAMRVQAAVMMVRTLKLFDLTPPNMAELEAVVKGGMAEYRRQYELLRDRDMEQHSYPGDYMHFHREAVTRELGPYFSEQYIGPIYYYTQPGQNYYKHGRGVVTSPHWAFTMYNELEQWAMYPNETIEAFEVRSVSPVQRPDGSGPILMDGYAKVNVALYVEHTDRQGSWKHTWTLQLHLKRIDGKWLITQMIHIRD